MYIIFFSIKQTVVKNGRQFYNHCLSETENVFLKQLKMQLDCYIIKIQGLQQIPFVHFLIVLIICELGFFTFATIMKTLLCCNISRYYTFFFGNLLNLILLNIMRQLYLISFEIRHSKKIMEAQVFQEGKKIYNNYVYGAIRTAVERM